FLSSQNIHRNSKAFINRNPDAKHFQAGHTFRSGRMLRFSAKRRLRNTTTPSNTAGRGANATANH
ncbi:MAG: hypothetical protein ACK6DB_10875, partial [Planctomycetota bacterium]